jgi:UDPglucose 6-dehydrogenase
MNNVKKIFNNKIRYGKDEYEILKEADALIIATEWSLFRTPDFEKMKSLMKNKAIFDGRNLYGLSQMRELRFYYNSIGRETIS